LLGPISFYVLCSTAPSGATSFDGLRQRIGRFCGATGLPMFFLILCAIASITKASGWKAKTRKVFVLTMPKVR
jgi:hypothetical protein